MLNLDGSTKLILLVDEQSLGSNASKCCIKQTNNGFIFRIFCEKGISVFFFDVI